jgi:predicted RNA binding protein YcfA (HicA-like mRNA interferase family)
MSPKLPVVSSKEVIKALQKIGYEVVRQKGSHIRLRNYSNPKRRPITVPNHKYLKQGLLKNILNDTELSVEEFINLL